MRISQRRRERKEDESSHAQRIRVPVDSAMVNGLHFEEGLLASNPGLRVTLGRLPSLFPNHSYRVLITPPWRSFRVLNEIIGKYVKGSFKSKYLVSAKCLGHWVFIREVITLS